MHRVHTTIKKNSYFSLGDVENFVELR
jgi:hypothetical protein